MIMMVYRAKKGKIGSLDIGKASYNRQTKRNNKHQLPYLRSMALRSYQVGHSSTSSWGSERVISESGTVAEGEGV
jgi:hypothetical protein